jgi:hypothetical protein
MLILTCGRYACNNFVMWCSNFVTCGPNFLLVIQCHTKALFSGTRSSNLLRSTAEGRTYARWRSLGIRRRRGNKHGSRPILASAHTRHGSHLGKAKQKWEKKDTECSRHSPPPRPWRWPASCCCSRPPALSRKAGPWASSLLHPPRCLQRNGVLQALVAIAVPVKMAAVAGGCCLWPPSALEQASRSPGKWSPAPPSSSAYDSTLRSRTPKFRIE